MNSLTLEVPGISRFTSLPGDPITPIGGFEVDRQAFERERWAFEREQWSNAQDSKHDHVKRLTQMVFKDFANALDTEFESERQAFERDRWAFERDRWAFERERWEHEREKWKRAS